MPTPESRRSQNRTAVLFVLVFAVLFLVVHLFTAYEAIFERRPAFLYLPETDELYSVQMAASVGPLNPWKALVPFRSLRYSRPVSAERVGKLAEIQRREALSIDEVLEESKAEFEERGASSPRSFESEISSVALVRLSFHPPMEVESEALRHLLGKAQITEGDDVALVAGAIVSKKFRFGNGTTNDVGEPETVTFEEGLLFERYAVGQLLDAGLASHVDYYIDDAIDPPPDHPFR